MEWRHDGIRHDHEEWLMRREVITKLLLLIIRATSCGVNFL